MLRPTTLAVLVTSTATFAAPIPKEQPEAKAPNYFPCELGTKWEYECGQEFTVYEVTKVRHQKDTKIATITITRPSTGAKADVRYRVTKEAVYSIEKGKPDEFELLQLKFDAKPGDSWAFNAPGHFADGAKITAREPATVEVPAGKFKVIGTSLTFPGVPAEQVQLTSFYADGIGRVMSPATKAGQPPIVLRKFTPPPK